MLEKDITNAIMRYLKTVPSCFAWKEHGGIYGTAGLPDILCCIGGRFVGFEVKTPANAGSSGGRGRPEGKLTKLQESTIAKIKAAKGQAFKVTSVGEVKAIIENL